MKNISVNMRAVQRSEMNRAYRELRWCLRHNALLSGYPYTDDLQRDGVNITLYMPYGTSLIQCQSALEQAYLDRDVISHQVLLAPNHWFESVGEAYHVNTH